MKRTDMLIGTVDLLLLLLVLFYLSLLAIQFDSAKGLADRDYLWIKELQQREDDVVGNDSKSSFMAVIIDTHKVKLYRFKDGRGQERGDFMTSGELVQSGAIEPGVPYVIYERSSSALLGEVIRELVLQKCPIAIAELSRGTEK